MKKSEKENMFSYLTGGLLSYKHGLVIFWLTKTKLI